MATTKEKWQEIANRGLQDKFDPDTRAKFDEAVKRGLIVVPDAQQAEPEILTGTGQVTDEGRPIFNNQFGDSVTERTITVTDPRINNGRATNIPTVSNGQFLDQEAAIQSVVDAEGVDPITGRNLEGFDSIDQAVASAEKRSANISIPERQLSNVTPEQRAVLESLGVDPENPQGIIDRISGVNLEDVQGRAELLATVGTGAVLEPLAGVAGIVQAVNPFAEEGAGGRAVRAVQDLGFKPREAGRQVVQDVAERIPESIKQAGAEAVRVFQEAGDATNDRFGPLAATILTVAPVAVLEAIPGGLALKKARGLATTIADDIAEEGVDALRLQRIETIKAGAPPEAKDYADIADDLKSQRIDNLAEQVLPDQEILDAAEALNVDLNPSHYSTNRAFIDVENSLKSRAGSKLATVEERAILDTGRAADNLIEELKGATDKSLLDLDIKDDINFRINALEEQSSIAYQAVDEAIPRNAQVNPTASRAYINRVLDDLGGQPSAPVLPAAKIIPITPDGTAKKAISNDGRDIGSITTTTKGNVTNIDDIEVFRSGTGEGTRAIQDVMKNADDTGGIVTLTSDAMRGKAGQAQNRKLYKRLGFVKNTGANKIKEISEEFYYLGKPSGKVAAAVEAPTAKPDIDTSLLTSAEKKLLRIAEDDSHLTYAAIDRIRKDIGAALGKKSGPFKDDDAGVLKQLYKVLSEDQQGVADAFGVGADYSSARKLVSTRKALENEAVSLFGREVSGSIIPKLNQAATALTKGDVSKFNSLMAALPASRRQEVAATMLNDLFTSGARKKGSISGGFASAFAALNRNKAAKKTLFDQLPAGAEKRFDDIGKVATGIFKSKALENNSRTARDILAALEEGGLIARLYAGAKSKVPNVPSKTAIVAIIDKVKTPATDTADELLTSASFKKAVEDAASGNLNKSQEITRTRVFKNWLTAQTPEIQKEVAAIGFVPYLTQVLQSEQDIQQ